MVVVVVAVGCVDCRDFVEEGIMDGNIFESSSVDVDCEDDPTAIAFENGGVIPL